jgi:hypothetical protein
LIAIYFLKYCDSPVGQLEWKTAGYTEKIKKIAITNIAIHKCQEKLNNHLFVENK